MNRKESIKIAERELGETKPYQTKAKAITLLADKIMENAKLTKAICPDDSITDVDELIDFAKELQDAYEDAYNKLCDVDIVEQDKDKLLVLANAQEMEIAKLQQKLDELKEAIKPTEYYSVLGSEYKKYLEWRENGQD